MGEKCFTRFSGAGEALSAAQGLLNPVDQRPAGDLNSARIEALGQGQPMYRLLKTGQPAVDPLPQRVDSKAAVARHHGNRPLTKFTVVQRDHKSLLHAGMGHNHPLHLFWLDPLSTAEEEIIHPSEHA